MIFDQVPTGPRRFGFAPRSTLSALLLLTGFACGGDEVVLLKPSRPEAEGGQVQFDSLPPSVVAVPVEISLTPLVRVIEREVPRRIGSLEDRKEVSDNDRVEVAFTLERDSIEARFTRFGAELSTTLAYRVRAWYDPPVLPEVSTSCGTGDDELPPRISAAVRSPLTLDRDWKLRSRVELTELEPASDLDRDRCTITVFDFDVTGHVIDAARTALDEIAVRADSAVAAIDIRSDFDSWWTTIATPIELDEDVWLLLAPEEIGRDEFVPGGDEVSTRMSVRMRPRIFLGPKPDSDSPPLPPLEKREIPRELSLRTEAVAPWTEITHRVNEEAAGDTFQVMGREIRVDSVEVWGIGDGRIALGAMLSGAVRGTAYLVGTPVWDPDTNMVSVPDLDFDVRTRDAVVAGAAWLADVGLVAGLRHLVVWDASPALDWARMQIRKGFNTQISSQVRLEGEVGEVAITDILATQDALHIRAHVGGRATLYVVAADGSR